MDQVSGSGASAPMTVASASYPRIYRYSTVARVAIYACAALMGTGAGWLVYLGVHDAGQGPSIVLLWCGVGLGVLAGLMASSCAVSRMTLSAGSIEVRGLFSSRELRRDAIIGRRLLPTRGKPIQVLVPRNGRALRLDSGYPRDAVLDGWIDSLPDLDKQERDASEAQLAADRTYGASPQERLEHLANARKIAKVANGAALVICAWGYIFPRPYPLAIAALTLLPWVAVVLVAWSKGLIRFDTTRNDVRPNVASLLLLPGAALALRALSDIHLIDVRQALELGFLAGLPLVAAVLLVHQRDDTPRGWGLPVMLLALVALPYGAGVLSLGDVLLDHAAPRSFSTEVTGKYISRGKHPQPTLILAPWGPKTQGGEVTVARDFYAQTSVNSTVCATLHPGEAGLQWYAVQNCERAGSVTSTASP